jgi:hypothetical protein
MITEPLNRPSPNPSRIREGGVTPSPLAGAAGKGEICEFAIILTLAT